MKLRGIVLVFSVILLLLPVAFAASNDSTTIVPSDSLGNENTAIAKAYTCLQNEVSNRSSLSFQEAVFAGLAIGGYKTIPETIDREKASDACWPKAGCKVRDTAQVMLAYQKMGKSTDAIKQWLASKTGTAPDLSWYLEIDSENQQASKCTVSYDGRSYNVNIADSRILTGTPGPCLDISSSKYLLKVRESCLDKTFEVSCDQSFVSTMLYQKNRGSNVDCLDENNLTCYVSSETHAGASLGRTSEKISAQCVKNGNSCDYEGTLWTALALYKAGNTQNVSTLTPYLLALADDNERFFPYSFLSAMTGDDDYYSKVIELRKQNQYWELSASPYNRFYNTALGLLALGASSASKSEADSTKSYLLSIQTPDGCWNNNKITDTGFLLYAGWNKGGVSSGGSAGSSAFCTEAGFSCERLSDCTAAGGQVREGFECSGVGICCSVQATKPTCSSQNGQICGFSQRCDGNSIESASGSCCIGSCTAVTGSDNVCEIDPNALCKASCGSGETATADSCGSSGGVCCVASTSSGGWGWTIFWAILIILVILAIVFRHKLQLWWFSFRNKGKTTSVKPGSSGSAGIIPAQRQMQQPRPFMGVQQRPRPITRPLAGAKDKELDDTLKKLRDMTK